MTWRCGFLFVWMVHMTVWVHAQIRPVDSFKQTVSALREQDDLESATYAFIDEYLKHPTEANLLLFDAYEKERWRSWIKKEEYQAYVILLCNQGYYLTQYGNVQESILAYEKASRLFNEQRLTDFDIIEYCLKPLGNNYSMLGDYKSAANIVKDYLYLAEQQHNHEQLVAAYINLSVIDHDTGHYREAILLLQQALTKTQLTAEKKLLIHYNLARNYAALREFAKARHYADQVIAFCTIHRSADTLPTLVNVYTLLSITALSDHQAVQALSFIMKAHSMAWSNAGLFKTRELAKINNTYAGVLLASGHYKDALKNYQRSLMLLLPQYDAAKNELPEASMFYAENTIKETLDGMADACTRLGQPDQALACYVLRFDAEDLLRETYNYEEAKLQQQAENRNVTEQAIELLYALSKKKNDNHYAVKAFQFAERTKAMILREQIEDRYWRKLVAQDTLIKKENTLRYKQALLASEISSEQMKQQQANVEYIRERTGQQTSIAMELKAIATALEKKYLGRKRDVFFRPEEITDLQRTLKKDNATLVEFFFGKRAVYMFRVDDQYITMTKTDSVDRLKQNILALHDLFTNAEAIHHQVERYKDLAFGLSQSLHLTEPMASPNLVLVPDGLLHLVPFDALLYEKKPGIHYQDFSWLLKRYTISYQSSASLYTRSSVALVPLDHQANVLGIFPMFPDSPRQLDYSEKEAHDIRDQMEGLFLINKQATRHAFLEQANQFPIIHLSTHASAGTDVEPPSIQFIDSTLYLPSIYGLHLNADLLVLSACETGKGVMVKGEGAMSLAHGFQFAGVRNIIFSLWKVNDYTTAVLMNNFYNQYRSQGSKAEGLQMAKLDYLKDETVSNARKSPYYWAGFVYYGSLEKQLVTKAWPRLAMACAISIGGMVLFIFIAIKRSKKNHINV